MSEDKITQPLIPVSGLEPQGGQEPVQQPEETPTATSEGTSAGTTAEEAGDASDVDQLAALDQIRAAVLGACDGIVTTGALVTGIAAANASQHQLLLSAVASMASGSISMAVGEYVSMTQKADMERAQGMDADGGVSDAWTAALTSWACFIGGAIFPTLAIMLPEKWRYIGVCAVVVVTLILFGAAAGWVSRTSPAMSAFRLVLGGVIAMVFTTAVGRCFGVDPSSSILVQMWSADSNICTMSSAEAQDDF